MIQQLSTLLVSDIFLSVQGEGPKLGTPSLFLRLGSCNLQCSWCDTPYTWKKGQTDYKEQKFDEIIATFHTLLQKNGNEAVDLNAELPVKNLVITGGEPLLQQAALIDFLRLPALQTVAIEFETNGSLPLLPKMKELIETRNGLQKMGANVGPISFNISPKLADSGNKPYPVHFYPNSVLKFVYVDQKSEMLIDLFTEENKEKIGSREIFIMPEGTSIEKMSQKYNTLLAYCSRKGWRFSPRLHIYLFGNQRAT